MNKEVELTEAENELYDRQIRLWGMESQKRLRTAKVLICGLNGIGAEVTKNLILSGVHSVRLLDDQMVAVEDCCSQFLIGRSAIGTNRAEASIERARALNPMVEISVDTEKLSKKHANYFIQFDVVVVIGASTEILLYIDGICRENGIKFFAGDAWGLFGFCFADLQTHTYIEDTMKHKVVSKPNEKVKTELITTSVQRQQSFPPFQAVLDFDVNSTQYQHRLKRTGPAFILLRILQIFKDKFNRDPSCKTREVDMDNLISIRNELCQSLSIPDEYFSNIFNQISPTCAVIGGVIAQEVIKVISKKEAPHCNIFLFDPDTCCGFIETFGII